MLAIVVPAVIVLGILAFYLSVVRWADPLLRPNLLI